MPEPAIAAATVTFTTNGNVSITGFTAESKTHSRDFTMADAIPIDGQTYFLIDFNVNDYIGSITLDY